MADLAEAPLSTVIDEGPGPSQSGGGQPALSEPVDDKAPPSLRDELVQVFKADDEERKAEAAKPAEPEAKPAEDKAAEKPVEKPRAPDGKFAKPAEQQPVADKPQADQQADGQQQPAKDGEQAQEQQGKRNIDPPQTMLPRAKELWRNTPREVQAEIERITRESTDEIQRYQERTQRYEAIRPFDELAKQNGRDLRDSLVKINQLENTLQQNPIAGLHQILAEIGPKKADGSPLTLMEVAQHIVSQPQNYQQMVAQPPQQPRENPEVARLKQELHETQAQHVIATVIEPFRAQNPRYDELEPHIAKLLHSDMIPASLSVHDRLAEAYDMAVRLNPSAHVDPPADSRPAAPARAVDDLSGSRSIRSAPGAVTEEFEDEAKSGESIRDSLRNVMRRRA